MVRVGRDLCGSPSPTPCRSRVTYSRLHRTASRRVLNISREGDSRDAPVPSSFLQLSAGLSEQPGEVEDVPARGRGFGTRWSSRSLPTLTILWFYDSMIFLEVGSPELDTALQMGPHQGRVEGEENLPWPAAHTPLDAPQDPVSFLGSQGTLLAHGQPVVPQHSQSLSTELLSSRSAPSCTGAWVPVSSR